MKVWDVASRQELLDLTIRGRTAIRQVFFIADGRLVATSEAGPPVVFDARPRTAAR